MCIFKSKIEAAAFKEKIKLGHASPFRDKCAYLNQSDLHGQCDVGADLPYFRCVSGSDALYQGLH